MTAPGMRPHKQSGITLTVGQNFQADVHFDLQGALHGGGLFTDRGFAPAVSASAGILARLNRWVFLQLDLGLLLSFEQRQRSGAALGLFPLLSAGAEL